MNKRLKKIFLTLATMAATNNAQSQISVNLSLVNNNLTSPLAYFERTVQEPEVKKAIEQAQILFNDGVLTDSLASALINVENLFNAKLDEYFYLNYKPYEPETLLALYEKTANLLQNFAPQEESLFYASAIYNLADMIMLCDYKQHRYDTRVLMEKAFQLREKKLSPNSPDYVESLYGMARVYHVLGNNEKALQFIHEVMDLAAEGEGKVKNIYAGALQLLGRIYTNQHRYNEAARILEQENVIRKEYLGEDSSSYALRLYVTGDLILYTGEYSKSLFYFTKALERTRKTLGEENFQYAFCLDGVGTVYYNVGDYQQAVPYYIRALAIKVGLHDYYGLPLAYHQLATAYVRMGLYAQAQPLFERGCTIVEKEVKDHAEAADGYGYFLSHLASIYRVTHQYAKAYPLLRKAAALTVRKDSEGGFFHSVCLQNLALLFQNTGRYDSALFYFQKVLSLKMKTWGEKHFQYASALHDLSGLYAKMNRLDTALLLCRQASDIRADKLGKEHADYAASLALMGELYTSLHSFDTAEKCLRQALRIREITLGPDHPDYIKTLNSLAKLAIAEGKNAEAALLTSKASSLFLSHLNRTYTSLSEQEKLNLVSEEYDQFSLLPSLLHDDKSLPPFALQQVYASELLLKGMVLDDQQQVFNNIRRGHDSTASSLYFSWRTNRDKLAKQYFLPIQDRMASFDSLKEKTNSLEEELTRYSALFRQQKSLQAATMKDIANKLKPGEAAIEFIRYHYYHHNWTDSILYSALIVLPGDSTGVFVPLFEEESLKQLLRSSAAGEPWAIKKLYSDAKQNLSDSIRTSLYRLIWKPLQTYLSGAHAVYFAPVGLLNRIAFAALRTEDDDLIIDKYKLNQMFSTRSLLFAKPSVTQPSFVSLWASMTYKAPAERATIEMNIAQKKMERNNLRPLVYAQQEIKGIAKVCTNAGIHTAVTTGKMATEEGFKKLDGNSPEVLHIATHGVFKTEKKDDENNTLGSETDLMLTNAMLGSSLLMTKKSIGQNEANSSQPEEDGILTAYEIAQMDLSKTRLAVLSACNTALGELQGEEGVLGLQRALKLAGVAQMIISLWKVPDNETTELMQLFYQALLKGKDTREALRTAQLQMRQKYSPFYWAAFVVVD